MCTGNPWREDRQQLFGRHPLGCRRDQFPVILNKSQTVSKLIYLLQASGITKATFLLISLLACVSSLFAVLPAHFLGATVNAIIGRDIKISAPAYSPIGLLNDFLNWATTISDLPNVIIFLFLFLVSSLLFQVMRNAFAIYVSVCSDKFILYIRQLCFSKMLKSNRNALENPGHGSDNEKLNSGEIVHRLMNDTQQLDYLIGNPLYTLCSDILDLIWISVIILVIDWKILVILFLIIPLLFIVSKKTGILQRRYAQSRQSIESESTGFIQQTALGLDSIKFCQAEEREIDSLLDLNKENYKIRKKSNMNLGFFFFQESAIRSLGTVTVLAYVAYLATQDPTFIGIIPIILLYITKFYAPLANWARYYQTIQRGLISYKRLLRIIELPEEPTSIVSPAAIDEVLPFEVHGKIKIETGDCVPISLVLPEPGLVVIQGKSGAGKTRLAQSLLGLGVPFQGVLKTGNVIRIDEFQHYRNHIAFASQDSHFVPGTLADNICYPFKSQNIVKCNDILSALRLNFSLDHTVAEYGNNLSKGEQRRIILGRALYSDKPILILDEIDANVDAETRQAIYKILEQEKKRRIILMITHIGGADLADIACQTIQIRQEKHE